MPSFEKSLYTVILQRPNELKVGDPLGKVNAFDFDGDSFITNKVAYSIIGFTKERFALVSEYSLFNETIMKTFKLLTV